VADGKRGSRNGKINRPTHGVKLLTEWQSSRIIL
jgi:hypothetical protein